MSSNLVWFTIAASFRLNRPLWNCPLQWDPQRRRFFHKRGISFWWYVAIFGNILLLCCGSIGYVLYGEMTNLQRRLPLHFLVEYVLGGVACLFVIGICIYITFFADETVIVVNTIIRLYEEFHPSVNPLGVRFPKKEKLCGIRIPNFLDADGKIDRIGLTLLVALLPAPFIPLPVAIACVYLLKMDVFIFILEDLFPHSVANSIFLTPLRVAPIWIASAEMCRIFPFVAFVMGVPAQLLSKSGQILLNSELRGKSEIQRNAILVQFNQLRVLNTSMENVLAAMTFVLMGTGLVISSLLNFATITFLHAALPRVFYLMFPFLSTTTLVIIFTLLPFATGDYENSVATLSRWRELVGLKDKELCKRLLAMRPRMYYAGLNKHYFYSLTKSMKGTYMMAIVDNTVNLLMTIPSVHI
ncbi:uncharacterized protein LOC118435730 [Folsomia candida]|uniref:Gustatory receptor n=1 Tax=Folsomia candida TaxID=158441 RepID=A0A226E8X8_FOLCA|nr:uncharacterized protein LOC118435730 [Folsomia candida]OXA53487.1 hypothetical protein Fcan01_11497 [Folsomia candida]